MSLSAVELLLVASDDGFEVADVLLELLLGMGMFFEAAVRAREGLL